MSLKGIGAAVAAFTLVFFMFGSSFPPAKVRPALAISGVTPVLECVEYDPGSKEMTARFGYVNKNLNPVTIPVGEANHFYPVNANRGQPTLFIPGYVEEAFTVTVPVDTYPSITWYLLGTEVTAGVDEGPYCVTADPADLSVSMSAPESATPGGDLTYDIEIKNAGPHSATGVTLVDALPGGVDFVSATPSAGTCSGTKDISCSVGEIPRDGKESVSIKVSPRQAGELVNTANVTMNESDLAPFNNFATSRTSVTATAPKVLRVSPGNGARNVPFTSNASAIFSTDVDPGSLTDSSFRLIEAGATGPVTASIRYDADNRRAVLDPASDLATGATYTATLSSDIRSKSGVQVPEPKSWTFTVSSDDVPPTVTEVTPQPGGKDIEQDTDVKVAFSEEMRAASLTSNTIRLQKRGTTDRVQANVDYDPSTETVTLAPQDDLVPGTSYTAIVSTGVRDTAGNRLGQAKVWFFKVAG